MAHRRIGEKRGADIDHEKNFRTAKPDDSMGLQRGQDRDRGGFDPQHTLTDPYRFHPSTAEHLEFCRAEPAFWAHQNHDQLHIHRDF
jgi:hypothetical protein